MVVGNAHSVDDRSVCAGYENGDISLFDLRKVSMLWNKNMPKTGICSVAFDSPEKPRGNIFWTGLNGAHGVLSTHQTTTQVGPVEAVPVKDKPAVTIWRGKPSPHNPGLLGETDLEGNFRILRRFLPFPLLQWLSCLCNNSSFFMIANPRPP